MRSITHWKPNYVLARSREVVNQTLNPHHPWLTRQSVDLLDQLLRPSDVALEFGSGRSTRWFAKRVRAIKSVEHDAGWHQSGLDRLKQDGTTNVELLLRPLDVPEAEGAKAAYVRVLDTIADTSIDVCLVDGMYRGYCALGTIPKIRAGGLIVIDNAGWFFPSKSKTPGARVPGSGMYDEAWTAFAAQTASWRRIWTSSGVTDTVLMFKG